MPLKSVDVRINLMAVKEKNAPELLSPAGDWDSLKAGILNGADAVYLGVTNFNARRYARNFTLEDLAKAVTYAHGQGVRVYLTLNILVKNSEISSFFETLSRAYASGIDGVIIQHASFLEIIKSNYPGLAVFLSTQAAVGNTAAASLFKSADRIILPRELSLAEIRRFTDAGFNTEVFIHGAMCYSYSGLCLFSSFVGNRSGNRGSCAQLCRQRYNGSYPLSTKELCLVKRIPDLIEAGVKGFKIEGRMRSPLYTAVATRLYRKAIDSCLRGKFALPEKELNQIEVVFNREFTEGFCGSEKEMISGEKPMNRGAFLGEIKDGKLILQRPVRLGDGIGVWQDGAVSGSVIKKLTVNGKEVRFAGSGDGVELNMPVRDGANVYLTSSSIIKIEPDFQLKRTPISDKKRPKITTRLPVSRANRIGDFKLMVKAYSLREAVESAEAGADIIFLDIFSHEFPALEWKQKGKRGAYVPRILDDGELESVVALLRQNKPEAILTGNIGLLKWRNEFDIPVYTDYAVNTFNDLDVAYFRGMNIVPMVSPELSLTEFLMLKDKSVSVFCHGDVILMNTKIDPGCGRLTDEKGSVFPVTQEHGYWQILNSHPYGIFNDMQQLIDAGFTQFYLDTEGNGAEAVSLYRKILDHKPAGRNTRKGFTSGHLYKPVL